MNELFISVATASAIDWPALEKALRQVLPPRAVVSKAQELLSYIGCATCYFWNPA